ncbi:MAG: molecular chaperone DnaJ [Actinomycetota bacterium]|nr:molecular chaperone DnaJ [Actinomycetota bacterium]
MPTTARVAGDLYAVLGVDVSASGDEIARAYRARAKQLHPDTSDDPGASDRFNELVDAYGVLANHRTRREYDQSRAAGPRTSSPNVGSGARIAAPGAAKPKRWTRRRALTAIVGGALVTLLGVGAAVLTWQLHQSDARRHAQFQPVDARRVAGNQIMFVAADGRIVRTKEPAVHGEGNGLGPTVRVRYDPANPTHVIVDSSTLGRDITFAIVALKLLIGGPVFVVLGARRLRATNAR